MNVMSFRSYTNLGRWSWRLCGLRSILIFSTKVIALLSQRYNLHHPTNPYNDQFYNQRTVLCLNSKHTAAAEPYIHGKFIFSASLLILITSHVWWFHLYKPWNIPLIKRSNFCYSRSQLWRFWAGLLTEFCNYFTMFTSNSSNNHLETMLSSWG